MSNIEPRRSRSPRRAREQRAYRLATIGGGAALVAVAGFVLAVIGVLGHWLWILAAIVAVACGVLFRRTVS